MYIISNNLCLLSNSHFAFGAGRRICPGKGFAQHRLFLVMIYILQRFNISLIDHEENSKMMDNPEKWIFDLVISPGKSYAKFSPK